MNFLKSIKLLVPAILLFAFSSHLSAQETSVMVRVQAKDAKFIGSSMGGAKVIVREDLTGKILAEGVTTGSTGNTAKIMEQPRKRGVRITDEETAGLLLNIKIDKPVFVTVEAYSPINSEVKTETQLWLLPGKDLLGDGLVLEISGFFVEVLSPRAHQELSTANEIEITANIVLMCGCPISSGGMWNADQYTVEAIISQNGKIIQTVPMDVTETSLFMAKATLPVGNYEIAVAAFDPVSGNTGLGKTSIRIN